METEAQAARTKLVFSGSLSACTASELSLSFCCMEPDAKLRPGKIVLCPCFQGTLHWGACLSLHVSGALLSCILSVLSKAPHGVLTFLNASAPMDPWPVHPGEASSPCSLPQSHFIILRFYFCFPVHLGHFLFPSAFSALSLFQAVVIIVHQCSWFLFLSFLSSPEILEED